MAPFAPLTISDWSSFLSLCTRVPRTMCAFMLRAIIFVLKTLASAQTQKHTHVWHSSGRSRTTNQYSQVSPSNGRARTPSIDCVRIKCCARLILYLYTHTHEYVLCVFAAASRLKNHPKCVSHVVANRAHTVCDKFRINLLLRMLRFVVVVVLDVVLESFVVATSSISAACRLPLFSPVSHCVHACSCVRVCSRQDNAQHKGEICVHAFTNRMVS